MNRSLVGQKFGKLTVLEDTGKRKHRHKVYLCLCECGNTLEVISSCLLHRTTSCGCERTQKLIQRNKENAKHLLSNSRIYNTWAQMIQRCKNPKNEAYKYYGERGIQVCIEWECDFRNFYKWAISHGYDDTLTIDRIDNNGNYEPLNCRWVSTIAQNQNKRTTPKIQYQGKEYGRSEFARFLGIPGSTVRYLYNKGETAQSIAELAKKIKKGYSLRSMNRQGCKKILCTETMEVYYGVRDAGRKLNIDSSTISKVCKGKLKSAHGLHFKYVE